ncbi:MAG: cache domain-containing protein [Chitinispirillia bacterium]
MKYSIQSLTGIIAIFLIIFSSYSQVSDSELKITEESIAKCKATSSVKATPEMIIEKVEQACVLVEKKGKKAFPAFKGKNSDFLFAGTYIWINDLDGLMLMHPIKPKMVGNNYISLKDISGKRFLVEMINKVIDENEGWVEYLWPKPGEKESSLKVSYVKKAICNGKEVLIGCGTYDISRQEIRKLSH